ncbi:hypothetical protein C1T31_05335 [Hanstruepera neustonica]|uniref:Uncharacterized protein n=1 Tax=Hanstruepera neustonica TaxID=1445657 RepID=A0A2K1E0F9_9FLAO|nr:hypothetical protein [Hanstruepera neustonica]PNQ73758.1 hypothetical protein C1T31_05335 [Hanstruepera neustonica]
MIAQSKRFLTIILCLEALLLIPLIAIQFTPEVNWSYTDFIIMGALLLTIGVLAEYILRIVKNQERRIILIAFLILAFLLIWAELAVGIFGTPFAGS